jgi:hypothetical protein
MYRRWQTPLWWSSWWLSGDTELWTLPAWRLALLLQCPIRVVPVCSLEPLQSPLLWKQFAPLIVKELQLTRVNIARCPRLFGKAELISRWILCCLCWPVFFMQVLCKKLPVLYPVV